MQRCLQSATGVVPALAQSDLTSCSAWFVPLQASRRALWAMPLLQVGWLAFFLADAALHFWYNWWLLLPCFATGEPGHAATARLLVALRGCQRGGSAGRRQAAGALRGSSRTPLPAG